ncbi:uncharacterized protein LOC133652732, partial [Entelurus aequoreus]|uniref:uncharacterized protein LOC133652732 n=1 Tax=Entelurus aequoreus TaxID=161455 RepID=UPI002B1D5368
LNEIKQWMSANFLQLNAKKTEMLIICPAQHQHLFNNTTLTFDNQTIKQGDSVKNLGIIFDPTLSFESHIKSVTKTAFFHLRNIAKIRSILSTSDAEIIIHAFVTSRLDYCNVLFSGLPMSSIKRLQLVQNAAARLLTKTRKFDHITPILAHLHWLSSIAGRKPGFRPAERTPPAPHFEGAGIGDGQVPLWPRSSPPLGPFAPPPRLVRQHLQEPQLLAGLLESLAAACRESPQEIVPPRLRWSSHVGTTKEGHSDEQV